MRAEAQSSGASMEGKWAFLYLIVVVIESLRLLLTIDNLSKGRLTPFCTEDSG
jgi:hypothetical protein